MVKEKRPFNALGQFLFIGCIAVAAFFLGVHREKVVDVYEDKVPVVRAFVEEKTPVVREKIVSGWTVVSNGTSTLVRKGQSALKKTVHDSDTEIHTSDSQTSPKISTSSRKSLVAENELQMASFNIRIFSNKSRNDEELARIAEVIKEHDLVAIQEVRDEDVIKRTIQMLRKMGHNFDYDISAPVGHGVKERYAFMYRTDKVQPVGKAELFPDVSDHFIREPFIGSYQSGDFDFTLINIHVLFGKNEAQRRPELDALADVYDYVAKKNPNERDIIVMGDFNMPPTDAGWGRLKGMDSMVYLISPPEKTTVTDTSLYDNFWFQKKEVREFKGRAGVDRFDESMFGNDDYTAKMAVSDHRPIWAVFDRAMRDDD